MAEIVVRPFAEIYNIRPMLSSPGATIKRPSRTRRYWSCGVVYETSLVSKLVSSSNCLPGSGISVGCNLILFPRVCHPYRVCSRKDLSGCPARSNRHRCRLLCGRSYVQLLCPPFQASVELQMVLFLRDWQTPMHKRRHCMKLSPSSSLP